MSNYKLTIQLKQHTPMIHFQGEQHGATLRATELKPKLDRFLIKKLKEEGINLTTTKENGEVVQHAKYKDWFIGNQHLALNYRVKIRAKKVISDKIKLDVDTLPNYFANMGVEYKDSPKYINKSTETVHLDFVVKCPGLKKAIEKLISAFFWSTNFGTRQSKGFGSFTVHNEGFQDTHFDLIFKVDAKATPNYLWKRNNKVSIERWKHELNLFGAIELFYKSLRSGINRKGAGGVSKFYIKPAIFYYSMFELKRQWDKKSIKEYYLGGSVNKQKSKHGESDILAYTSDQVPNVLIKDVFGLSSSESWLSYKKQVEKSSKEIDRFGSPLLFKPFDHGNGQYTIGIKCTEIDPDFLGTVFNVEFGKAKGLQLRVPNEFSWSEFWEFYFRNLPKLRDRLGDFLNQENEAEYKILSAIDNSLRQSNS